MARELHDHWFKEAKREGWRSRAIYKLKAIDEKRGVLKRGDTVLDCGCAPGSWLQYAATRIGSSGIAVGVDLLPLDPLPNPNIRTLQEDLRTVEVTTLQALAGLPEEGAFDVLLSDMAPNTTGHRDTDHLRSIDLCDMVLYRCADLLKEGGHLVMKVFEGGEYPKLIQRTASCFAEVRPMRPPASRSVSREMFIVAMSRKPLIELDVRPAMSEGPPPVPDNWGM
jgi:23S rRNA (uridine2552-2'-O)-methyltransferase